MAIQTWEQSVKGKEQLLVYAQHNLETKLKITPEERMWVMRYKTFPAVKSFWTAYKRALNFIHDTDKFLECQKHLKFVRTLIRSGINFEDHKLEVPK